MIDALASMQIHGSNGVGEILATLGAFLILQMIATK